MAATSPPTDVQCVADSEWRLPLILLLAAMGISYLPVALSLPFLPLEMHARGIGAAGIGTAMGAEALTAIGTRPFAGATALRRGRRRIFACSCLLIAAATLVNLFAAGTVAFVAGRLVLGLGSGGARAVAHAWTIDVVPANRRGRALGLVGLVTNAAVALAPPIGFLLERLGGLDAIWWFGALTALAALPLCLSVAEPVRHPSPPHAHWAGLRYSARAGTGVAASFAGYAALSSFAALALRDRGITGGASVLTAYGLAVIIARLLAGGAPDRFGAARIAAISAIAEGAGLLIIALADSLWFAVAGGVIVGLGMANMYPSLGLTALAGLDASHRSVVAATLGSFVDVGLTAGAPIMGLLVAISGYHLAFAIAATATSSTIIATLIRPSRRSARPIRSAGA